MQVPETFHEDFIMALVDADHLLVRELLTKEELPSWDMFINILDRAGRRHFTTYREGDPLHRRQINDAIFTDAHQVEVLISDEDMRDLEAVHPVWNLLRRTAPGFKSFEPSRLTMCLIGGSPESKSDRDMYSHKVYLQCKGVSEWRVSTEDDPAAELAYVQLNEGDILFMSARYYYSSKFPDASAGIFFTIDAE